MSLTLTAAPAALPISQAEVKAFARVDGSSEDDVIDRMIAAAIGIVDGAGGVLGRALITQTWALKLDGFPAEIALPLPPLQSVASIAYIDADGAEQTLSASLYQVIGVGDDAPAKIAPAYGQTWPACRAVPEAVTVTFIAGYGDAADVPGPIRQAIEKAAADLYAMRELPELQADVAARLQSALAAYRVWAF